MIYLFEGKGYSQIAAGVTVCWFEVGGFLGSLAAGWSSDFIFKGRRGPVNAIFAFFTMAMVFIFWKFSGGWIILDSMILFLIGFFIFGPQMLIGVVAAELTHKKAAGASTGFTGIFSYIGATVAGAPLGKLLQIWGWGIFFIIMSICSIVAVLLLGSLWSIENSKN